VTAYCASRPATVALMQEAIVPDTIECRPSSMISRREVTAAGQEERVKMVEAEIDSLLREKEAIEKWAVAGSA
jgi:hypothetical protein